MAFFRWGGPSVLLGFIRFTPRRHLTNDRTRGDPSGRRGFFRFRVLLGGNLARFLAGGQRGWAGRSEPGGVPRGLPLNSKSVALTGAAPNARQRSSPDRSHHPIASASAHTNGRVRRGVSCALCVTDCANCRPAARFVRAHYPFRARPLPVSCAPCPFRPFVVFGRLQTGGEGVISRRFSGCFSKHPIGTNRINHPLRTP